MSAPDNADLTPDSAAPTDIAPLGRTAKSGHEMTAEEERGSVNWDAIAAASEFKALLVSKKAFVLPTTIFFLVYYFALPILVGWFPDFMKTKIGSVNLAYLFALSQFFMTWIIAGIYVVKAAGWDKSAAALLAKFNH
jgi:uncharacterized membrane protein (DUF485 family)